MKAKFFLLGLCALGLMACSIDEVSQVNDTNAIQFKATTATRVAATTTNNLQEFTVWAWNDKNPFMDHVTATKNGSVFTTSPYYFWPTGTVDFYALAPASVGYGVDPNTNDELAYIGGEITLDEDDMGGTHYTYTGNVATADIAEDNIVIEAYIPGAAEDQIDLCYAITKERSSGAVPMNFRHALSQVTFKAKDVNEDFVVDIAGVSVCSVYKHGTYTLKGVPSTTTQLETETDDVTKIAGTQGEWTTEDYKARFEAGIEAQTLATDGTVVNITSDPLMLLPQTVEKWDVLTDEHDGNLGSYIAVLCHVTEHGSTLWPNANETGNTETIGGVEYAYIAMPVDIDWEEGYRYTYTIVFGEGLGYYPPDDPNWELDGTPVLVPITFNVTVDEFQDAEATTEGQFDVPTDVDLSYIEVKSADELVGAARMGYEVIDVEGDITLDGVYVEFTQDCTLNLADGVTITATNSTGTDYPSINGYNGYTAAICVTSGTLTINGEGSVVTTGDSAAKGTEGIWVNGGEVIINGGTYKGGSWNATDEEGSESAVFVEYGAAYIYGGTFYSGKWKESGDLYYVLNCMDTPRKNGQAWIYVYGGTYYSFDPSNCNSEGAGTNFVVDGYSSVDNGDGTYTVILTTVTTGVELQTALNAGASEITVSGTVTLNDGTSSYLTISNDCTIDIPEGSELLTSNIAGSVPGLYITGGTTTLTGSGTITYDEEAFPDPDSSQNYYTIWLSGGNVVIDGDLTFVGESHTVYAQKGFAYIYNGTFIDNSPTSDGTYWVLNCQDANYKADPRAADIYCYGGKYYKFDPANNTSEGTGTSFLADKETRDYYQSVADGDWYVVSKKD